MRLCVVGICVWVLALPLVLGAQSTEDQRYTIETEGHPSHGPEDAPITLVEFGDFECPNCGGLYPTLKRIEEQYPTEIRFVFRQLPLRQAHPNAQKAAEASLCAYEQDRFWEFHDSMFESQHDLSVESLKGRAVDFDLDPDRFNGCLDSGRHRDRIDRDIEAAIEADVTGTPTIYINGRKLAGNRPYEVITAIIEEELHN